MQPTLIDLFCGVGGISLGFESAGFRVLGGNDHDEEALKAFALNHPDAVTWPGPVEELDPLDLLASVGLTVGGLDVLAGGPPCQGFSQNRARRHSEGRFVDDPRNYLFKEFLRFVEAMQPKAVMIENVPQLLIKEGGRFRREIETHLGELGYESDSRVLLASEYGVPQQRKRAVILAAKAGRPTFPEATHGQSEAGTLLPLLPTVTVRDAIADLAGIASGEGASPSPYPGDATTTFQKERRRDAEEVTEHIAWTMSDVQAERLSYLKEGEGFEQLPPHLAPKSGYGSAYRRMWWDQPALTITTWMYHPGSGMFYHPSDFRTITLREGARLQSFDDSVVFWGGKVAKCRQVGNAMPPVLAASLAEELKRFI